MKTLHFSKAVNFLFIIFLFLSGKNAISQTFPIKMERNNTILPVVVGGIGPLKILFDTGLAFDGLMIYNPVLKDSIKLDNVIEVKIPGAGSGEPSTAIMDDSASFFVGDIEFKNQKVIVLQDDIYKGFPTDGIIGYSILGHFTTEIDYDTEQITLHNPENFSPNDSWQSIPIYFKDNPIPWIDVSVSIEGEDLTKISTYIDLADGDAIVLLEKDVMKFFLPKETKEILLGRGLSGDIYGKEGKISKLKIGSFELNEVTAKIAPAQVRSKQVGADAVIGNDALRRFNLIFDYRHKLLYIKPNKYFDVKFE
jgi:hypothetical protein